MKKPIPFAATISCVSIQLALCGSFFEGNWWLPIEVTEDSGVIRLPLFRVPDSQTNAPLTIPFSTIDGTAIAGRDYVGTQGAFTFLPGQMIAPVDIPILNNKVADGPRSFSLEINDSAGNVTPISNSTSDQYARDSRQIVINDDELAPTQLDPAFEPDVDGFSSWPMPDGRLLVATERGLIVMNSQGVLDPSFRSAVPEGNWLEILHIHGDGSILGLEHKLDAIRYTRLKPDGSRDPVDFPPIPESCKTWGLGCYADALPDGSFLMYDGAGGRLNRIQTDGRKDTTFNAPDGARLATVAPNGAIFVALRTAGAFASQPPTRLVQLKPDGTLDTRFNATFAPFRVLNLERIRIRTNGKILVSGTFSNPTDGTGSTRVQLNADGTMDRAIPLSGDESSWFGSTVELPDGGLATLTQEDIGWSVRRLNPDGTRTPHALARISHQVWWSSSPSLFITPSGDLFVKGWFDRIDGFPRRNLARIKTGIPRPEFRILTTEFSRSASAARIQVVRTGDVIGPASVEFSTRDGTAISGRDFEAQSGVLSFADGEHAREVVVPLTRTTSEPVRLRFNLELSHPSEGYAVLSSTSIAVIPEFRISRISVDKTNLRTSLTFTGLLPGLEYALEFNTDMGRRLDRGHYPILDQTTFTFESWQLPSDLQAFFRIVR